MTYDLSKMTPEQLEAHRIKRRAYEKSRRDKDPERFRAQWKASYHKDIDKTRERYRKAYPARYENRTQEQRDRKLEIAKVWRANNPEKARAIDKRKHQKKRIRKKPALLMDGVVKYLRKALPASLPTYARDDIISDVTLAVMEGKITLEQVPAKAKAFVTAHYRMFDQHKTLSLDKETFDGEGKTFVDMLPSDAMEWMG